MMGRLRPLFVPALCTVCVGAILVGLGVWQLHRLTWKEGIIATIESRTKAPPQPVPPPSAWPGLKVADYAYRHVVLEGTFESNHDTLIFRPSAEGAGYLLVAPLRLRDGGTVLVNRGFVPDELKDSIIKAAEPAGVVHVAGLMREPEARNLFTPADEPAKNTFFTRDPNLIAAHLGLTDAAPFMIDADAAADRKGWPHGGATELAIPNNHFSYAMTWFGLALGLMGVFVNFAWKRLSRDREGDVGSVAPLQSVETPVPGFRAKA